MPIFNGGRIGSNNDPTTSLASGLWTGLEQCDAVRREIWPVSRIVTDGLVLHLDAGDSASYPGSGTTWTDLSGNGRNFTWNSTPSFTSGSIPYFSTLGNRCTGPASNSFGIDNTSGYTIFLICMQNALVNTAAFKF